MEERQVFNNIRVLKINVELVECILHYISLRLFQIYPVRQKEHILCLL